MTFFHIALIAATFLCSIVAGFLFAFAVVVMPGIRNLDDGEFIGAFRAIDGVIQRNQPLFMFVWVGSVLLLVTAALVGLWTLAGVSRLLLILAAVIYLLGVQAPTVRVNIPLNNQLQRIDPGRMSETARRRARDDFEQRWNHWNAFRTVCASVVSGLLVVLLLRV
jgi:uncharacterized membrane protein